MFLHDKGLDMTDYQQLFDAFCDPYLGPHEGEDFCIDEQGNIQVWDNKTAALIMRKVNTSGVFDTQLVRIGQSGDAILLAFDTLAKVPAVFESQIGYQRSVDAKVKQAENTKFCIYLNGKRSGRTFAKLSTAKSFLKKLDKELQSVGNTVSTYEEPEDA